MTVISSPPPSGGATAIERVPPLRNGDRLSGPEFERRYAAMAEVKKAELIEGQVYMPSPVSQEGHGGPHFDVVTWLGVYRAATPGVAGGDNSSLRLDLDNVPQADACLMIRTHAGRSKVDAGGYVIVAPELIVEVAASSVSYDLHQKLHVYRKHGVSEYVVWRTEDRQVDWFALRNGSYERLELTPDGFYKSEVFPGLWLAPDALVSGDLATVLEVLARGLATPEHAAFLTRLASHAG
jgi:Uma2 family endonuclease